MKENPFIKWIENPDCTGQFANNLKKKMVRYGSLRVKKASEVVRLGHNGWYCDNNQDEIFVGVVVQLPARDGETYYLPGYREPWNDGVCVDTQHSYQDDAECARAADSMAERYAEDSREYAAKDTAEQMVESLREEIQSTRDRVRELIAGIRESKLAPVVCQQLREDIRRAWRVKTRCVDKIERLQDNYWLAVEGF